MDRTGITLLLAAGLLTVWCYLPLRTAGVVFEDDHTLHGVPAWVVPGRGLTQWTVSAIGLDTGRQHVANIGLHLGVGGALALVTASLTTPLAGVCAAAIWWLHPLNTEAVSYLTARGDVFVALWSLLAVWLAVGWTRQGGLWRLLLLGITVSAAVLSKEIGLIVFPLIAMTLIVCRCWRPQRVILALVTGIGGVVLGLTAHQMLIWRTTLPLEGGSVFSWPSFALLQLTALWHLLALVVWPVGLSIDHDTVGLGAIWTGLAGVGTVAALVVGGWMWRRDPLVTWAVGWLVISVVPRFIVPTNEFLKEYTLYPAWLGIAALLGMGAAWCLTARPVVVPEEPMIGVGA